VPSSSNEGSGKLGVSGVGGIDEGADEVNEQKDEEREGGADEEESRDEPIESGRRGGERGRGTRHGRVRGIET